MNNLARFRKAAGLTQVEVSEALGVDRSTVGKWEIGAALPRADKYPAIAELYGCTIGDLFEGEATQEGEPADEGKSA